MEEINELFIGIKNQAKYIHSKHNCGDSENLVYMATELKRYFDIFLDKERKDIEIIIDLLENKYKRGEKWL